MVFGRAERILFRWKSGLLHRYFNCWYTESQTIRMDRQLARRALTKFTLFKYTYLA